MTPEDKSYWENRMPDDQRRDWDVGASNWIEDYAQSKDHPHRQLMIDTVGHLEPFTTILEIGCNAGPNISLLRDRFPYLKDHNLYGMDVSSVAIDVARRDMPAVNWMVGSVTDDLPFLDRQFDVTLIDAVLMYVGPQEIKKAMDEITRVTKKGIVMFEWGDGYSELGEVKDFHWARSYGLLLHKRGFETTAKKLTEDIWPAKGWVNNGYVYTSVRR